MARIRGLPSWSMASPGSVREAAPQLRPSQSSPPVVGSSIPQRRKVSLAKANSRHCGAEATTASRPR
eukprot:scaffold1006_cov270-Pinguiococcus_pyrenoidosus.AAC.4